MPARKRIDPKSTPTDGRRNPERLLKRDPSKHYVWVNPNDEDCGVSQYLADGYDFERRTPEGVLAVGGNTKDGDDVWTLKGCKLMSCPLEMFEERNAAGQAAADAVDARILKKGNIDDGLRGQGYRLGIDQGQTSGPFIEEERA